MNERSVVPFTLVRASVPRVTCEGGRKATMSKAGMGPNELVAFFVDIEGNQMAMHVGASELIE